jgi:hypothetical protein
MNVNRTETKRDARGATLLAGAMMVAFLAAGCGRSQERRATGAAGEGPVHALESTPTAAIASATPPAAQPEATADGTATGGAVPVNQIDVLPPDVSASAGDTVVVPGAVIQVTAEASSDVTSITLTDGLGAKYPFTYDSTTTLWRVSYRVPIKIRTERLELSVTATNGNDRFKRVWVFLPIAGRGQPVAESGAGS